MGARRHPLASLVFAAAALALALAGCGGGDPQPIPRDQAAALIAELDETQRRVEAGACNDVRQGNFVRLDRKLERLPDDVDGDVEQALGDGVAHLKEVADQECRANRPPPTTTTTPEPSTTTTPEEPKREEDEDAPKETPTAPPPKDPEPPSATPDEEKGKGNGNGTGGTAPGVVPPAAAPGNVTGATI